MLNPASNLSARGPANTVNTRTDPTATTGVQVRQNRPSHGSVGSLFTLFTHFFSATRAHSSGTRRRRRLRMQRTTRQRLPAWRSPVAAGPCHLLMTSIGPATCRSWSPRPPAIPTGSRQPPHQRRQSAVGVPTQVLSLSRCRLMPRPPAAMHTRRRRPDPWRRSQCCRRRRGTTWCTAQVRGSMARPRAAMPTEDRAANLRPSKRPAASIP